MELLTQNKAVKTEYSNLDLMIAEFNQLAHSIRNASWLLRKEGYPVAINQSERSFNIRHNFLGAQKLDCFTIGHSGDLLEMRGLHELIKEIGELYK